MKDPLQLRLELLTCLLEVINLFRMSLLFRLSSLNSFLLNHLTLNLEVTNLQGETQTLLKLSVPQFSPSPLTSLSSFVFSSSSLLMYASISALPASVLSAFLIPKAMLDSYRVW